MALKKRKDITLGSGKLYVQEYTGTTVPETEAICTDDNILGYISGGATLSYKPTFYVAKDKETVIDAEFAADPMDAEGTLIYYDEVYTA